MNERLRVLAEQAGFVTSHYSVGGIGWIWVSDGYPIDNQLERFAALVRDDALEEAAKICDQLNYNGMNSLHCAQAIRNRAEEDCYDTKRQ